MLDAGGGRGRPVYSLGRNYTWRLAWSTYLIVLSRLSTHFLYSRKTYSSTPIYTAKLLILDWLDIPMPPLQHPTHAHWILPPRSYLVCAKNVVNKTATDVKRGSRPSKGRNRYRQTYMPLVVYIMQWVCYDQRILVCVYWWPARHSSIRHLFTGKMNIKSSGWWQREHAPSDWIVLQ